MKCHNGISLAGPCWPNIGSFVTLQGIQTSIAMEPYSFLIFQGVCRKRRKEKGGMITGGVLKIICFGQIFSGLCTSSSRTLTNSEVRKKRNVLFDDEKNRQLAFVKRIEKIKVEYKGLPENCTLLMNKNLSTPYNCAMRKCYP